MANTEPLVIQIYAEDETKQAFDSAERALKKQKKAVSDTLKRMEDYKNTIGMTADELQIYKLQQNGASEEQIRSAKNLQNLIAVEKKKIQSSKGLNGQMRLIRGGFGQLGHQVQDVAVQLQGGTDAMIVFGQQGGQIASVFGSGGAIIGAFLAVGAALITLIKNSNAAAGSFKALKESSDKIAELFSSSLLTSINDVTEELVELSKASEQMALTKVVLAQIKATQNLSDAQRLFNKELVLTEQISAGTSVGLKTVDKSAETLNRQFGVGMENIGEFQRLAKLLTTDLDANKDAFLAFALPLREKGLGTGQFNDLIDSVVAFGEQAIVAKRQISDLAEVRSRLTEGTLDDASEKDKRSRAQLQSIIDKNLGKTLTGEDQIRVAMNNRIEETIDAMKKLGKTEAEQSEARRVLEGQLDRQVSDMQNRRLEEFNKLDDARQKDMATVEKAKAQLEAFQRTDTTDIDKINKRYDAELDRARNLAGDREELAQTLAEAEVAIEAKRSAAITLLNIKTAQAKVDAEKRAMSTLEALQRSDVTDIDKINKRYDAELDRARTAAADRIDLAKMLADTEVAIEAKRSAAIQALRDKERQDHFNNIEKLRTAAIEGFATETQAFINNLVQRQAALEEARAKDAISQEELTRYSMMLEEQKAEHMLDQQLKMIGGLQNVENAITNASHAFITGAANGTEAIRMLGRAVMDELIKSIVQMGIEKAKQAIIAKNIEAGSLKASVTANAMAMKAIATTSYPAAALVSLATSGGNSAGATAGMGTAVTAAKAISLIGFEGGGFTGNGARSGGMDGKGGFLAMLHPNETVLDHTQGQGQGVTIINNIDASGNDDVDQRIAMAVTESSRQTVEQVHNMMRRGRM